MNKQNQEDHVIIQITDLHIFTNEAYEFSGVNPAHSLKLVIQKIKHEFPEFDHLVATGDLVQEPAESAYQLVAELLKEFDQKINYLPGNHDDTALMNTLLAEKVKDQININNWVIFCLDSQKPGSQGGYFTKEELTSLNENLRSCQDLNVIIFCHHQPVPVNSEWMDSMMLENANDFFNVIDQYDHVKCIAWGHNHQAFTQTRNNVDLLATPSTCVQYTPGSKDFDVDVDQKPGYRWFKLRGDGSFETGINRLDQDVTLSLK